MVKTCSLWQLCRSAQRSIPLLGSVIRGGGGQNEGTMKSEAAVGLKQYMDGARETRVRNLRVVVERFAGARGGSRELPVSVVVAVTFCGRSDVEERRSAESVSS